MSESIKIGIFGGSFNPITKAHLQVCEEACKYVDQVWILPAYTSLYGKKLVDPIQRLEMCKIALKNYNKINEKIKNKIKICDFEIINKIQNNSTFEIIKLLINEYKLNISNLYFIIGADNLINLNKFKNYDELIKQLKFIVIPRTGYHIDNNLYKDVNFVLIDCDSIDGSSTMVRSDFEKNQELLFENVKKYIEENCLYLDNKKNL